MALIAGADRGQGAVEAGAALASRLSARPILGVEVGHRVRLRDDVLRGRPRCQRGTFAQVKTRAPGRDEGGLAVVGEGDVVHGGDPNKRGEGAEGESEAGLEVHCSVGWELGDKSGRIVAAFYTAQVLLE